MVAEDKRMETMLAQEDHREAEIVLSMMKGLDEKGRQRFCDFASGVKYGMELEKKKTVATV